MFLATCIISLIGVTQAESIMRIVGGNIDGTIPPPPAGTCTTFQLVRDSGVQIATSQQITDLDIDVPSQKVWAGIEVIPLDGAALVNNIFRVDISGVMSVTNQAALVIRNQAGFSCDILIGPPFNTCVRPSAVRVDITNNLVYAGGIAASIGQQSLGAINATTLSTASLLINTYPAPGTTEDTALAFDSTLAWFPMGWGRFADAPNTFSKYRITRGESIPILQGPVNSNLGSNNSTVQVGNFVVDTVNSRLYALETDAAPAIRIRTFDFTLVEQGAPILLPVDTQVNNALLWVPSKNELVVCMTNNLSVYSGTPLTLARTIGVGCALPTYDSVNNKLYAIITGSLRRINYNTLVLEATQNMPGLTASGRLVIEIAKQFVYGVEAGGPLGGTAVARYDICASI